MNLQSLEVQLYSGIFCTQENDLVTQDLLVPQDLVYLAPQDLVYLVPQDLVYLVAQDLVNLVLQDLLSA